MSQQDFITILEDNMRLRIERDEARMLVLALSKKYFPSFYDAKADAARRGWDCLTREEDDNA